MGVYEMNTDTELDYIIIKFRCEELRVVNVYHFDDSSIDKENLETAFGNFSQTINGGDFNAKSEV